ncbi:MAG: autotransporter domain-containing protein [Pseudomonadota bacterium]
MRELKLLTTAAALTIVYSTAMAQDILDAPPEAPALSTRDGVAECAGGALIVCQGGVDPTGVSASVDGTEIVIGGDARVDAAFGASVFFPGFEIGAILEANDASLVIEDGGQVFSPTDFSFAVISVGANNTIDIAGDVIANGIGGGGGGVSVFGGAGGASNIITIEESGLVFTDGDFNHAVFATGNGNSIIVNGRVQSNGAVAAGVLAGIGTDISVLVGESGQVLATGDFSPALSTFFDPTDSVISFENRGLAQTFGNGAQALVLASTSASASNAGVIATLGDGSPGVVLLQSGHTFDNSGTVSTVGGDLDTTYEEFLGLVAPGGGFTPVTVQSAGVFVGNGGSSVMNSGTIVAENGPAIATSSEFADLTNGSGFGAGDVTLPVSITNTQTGTITGDVAILGSALIEEVVNDGVIVGDVRLESGDDSFTLNLDTGSVAGDIDGGAGTDALVLTGTGAAGAGVFDGGGQRGFETLAADGVLRLTGAFEETQSFAITGGAVFLDGAAVSAPGGATLAEGASLAGSGVIGGDLIANGVVDPGGPAGAVGLLTIDGDLTVADAGALLINVADAGVDRLAVGGVADIAGAVTIAVAASVNPGALPETATIIETGAGVVAAGLSAQTAQIGALTLVSTPMIFGNDVVVGFDVTSNFAGLAGLDANDAALASALDAGFAAAPAGGAVAGVIGGLGAAASPAAFDLISPEFYDATTRASVLLASRSLEQIAGRIQEVPFGARAGVWTDASFEAFDRDGDDVYSYEIDQFNIAFGADVDLGSIILGGAITYSEADINVLASPGSENGDVESIGVHGYAATTNEDGFNASATVGYHFAEADTLRAVAVPDAGDSLAADFSPDAFLAETRASYTQAVSDALVIRGGLAVDIALVDGQSFVENGDNVLAFAVETDSYEEVGGTASLDFIGRFGGARGQIRPFLGGFARQVFTSGEPTFSASFLQTAGGAFVVDGSFDRTEYGVNAGLAASLLDNRAVVSASYRGTFSDNNDSQQGAIRIVVPF